MPKPSTAEDGRIAAAGPSESSLRESLEVGGVYRLIGLKIAYPASGYIFGDKGGKRRSVAPLAGEKSLEIVAVGGDEACAVAAGGNPVGRAMGGQDPLDGEGGEPPKLGDMRRRVFHLGNKCHRILDHVTGEEKTGSG